MCYGEYIPGFGEAIEAIYLKRSKIMPEEKEFDWDGFAKAIGFILRLIALAVSLGFVKGKDAFVLFTKLAKDEHDRFTA